MADEIEPGTESDLRRRAAWLLGMLAVVAILFVVVMTVLIGTSRSHKDNSGPGPLDSAASTPALSSTQHSTSTAPIKSSSPPASTSATTHGPASCPTARRCALDDDIGNAVDAVNAYRTQHGRPAVPGAVSEAAKQCALKNGNGCTGGWSETQVPTPDGVKAVNKILQFAKLLSPMKSFGVGWAYDPAAKQYFFAIVRSD